MTSETMANLAAAALYDRRAEDIQIIHISDRSIIADYLVIASGNTDIMVRALAEEVQARMEEAGFRHIRMEGYREGRWAVIDYGDILVHIFHKEEREFYNLERLWSDGTNTVNYTGETGE
ncbi:ribosome silencing factor [Eubacteriales bacterium OttesenSCG-928-M02]|nr:ribosome silencing factor [Eubacteriales bacterium OttesenSCG-928-M02]